MSRKIMIQDQEATLLTYFTLNTLHTSFVIYTFKQSNYKDKNAIYIGSISKENDQYYIDSIINEQTIIIKNLVKDLIDGKINLAKSYQYVDEIDQECDTFELKQSQKILLPLDKYEILLETIAYIREHNAELLEKAKQEYYISLVTEKEKERRTIIFLCSVLVIVLSLLGWIIFDYVSKH